MSSSPYGPAARILSEIWSTRHKSLKTLAYDKKGSLKCTKATYAQVCHVLERRTTLKAVLEQVPISCRNEGLLYVLLHELLFGPNKSIRGGGVLKRQIMKKHNELLQALENVGGASAGGCSTAVVFPRYVRVNTLKATTKDVLQSLQQSFPDISIYAHPHVPNLFVLPPDATSIHDHELVKSGKIVLQDKSSCFSALCLVKGGSNIDCDDDGGDYIDACAAPGNKTSHLAMLLAEKHQTTTSKHKSIITACDRSEKRLESLQRRMNLLVPKKSKAVTVNPVHQDFLKTIPADHPNLQGILLDPSCSGSGIFTALDRQADNDAQDATRIKTLSNFQLTALKHAMSFPQVQRIVYSTCSLHEQENEVVVRQALQAAVGGKWELAAPTCLSHWKRRGRIVEGLTEKQAKCMIRADRGDETNGFFVAYFERKAEKPKQHREQRSKEQSTVGTIVPPKGINLYNGEFAEKEDETGVTQKAKKKRTKHAVSIETGGAGDQSELSTKKKPTPTAEEKPIPKKKAKKMAWKQKQAEKKKERLLRKQEKAQSAAVIDSA